MKRYKLLQDLPFCKAGAIFEKMNDYGTVVLAPEDCIPRRHMIAVNEIQKFDEWFEEIERVEHFFMISFLENKIIRSKLKFYDEWAIENLKSLGNYFETEQEAEEHLEWLKARAILLKDTKGFKPDWNDEDERKYCVSYDMEYNEFQCNVYRYTKRNDIFFASRDDLKYSLEVHEKEWKIYFGVEDE